MEPLNDNELRDLLQKWEAPAAPPHLERRIFGEPRHHGGFRWLLSGSIRIPVPVFVLLLVFSALIYVLPDRQAAPASAGEVSLSDFQPVSELKPRIIRRSYESN